MMESPLTVELRHAADQLRRGGQVSPNLLSEAADELVLVRRQLGEAHARVVRVESENEALLELVEQQGADIEELGATVSNLILADEINNNEKADG